MNSLDTPEMLTRFFGSGRAGALSGKVFRALRFRIRPLTSGINFYIILSADILLFSFSLFFAYEIRFDFSAAPSQLNQMMALLPFFTGIKALVFWFYGLYVGMWRYTGIADMWRLIKASVLSTLLLVSLFLFTNRFQGFSRGVFILDGCLTFLMTGGMRIVIRSFFEKRGTSASLSSEKRRVPIFIIGAGSTGEKTVREIVRNSAIPYQVAGIIDDDPKKRGLAIHDVPILGPVESLPRYAELFGIREVLIAMPSAGGSEMRRIVEVCRASDLKFKTLPGWSEIIDGKVSVKALRDVNYKDLLRRSPVHLDQKGIQLFVGGKTVLVTGAGGSIGSELCRQLIRFHPGLIILADTSEYNLYKLETEFRHRIGFSRFVRVLTDIRNEAVLDKIFETYRPQVVFHAAAYKHVPMMEENPWQAVRNNIYGTYRVMEAGVRHCVDDFVLISTDKAVRPTNVMGASKRVCEMLLYSFLGGGTRMTAVRFGNVLASSGSVIPLFRKQIAAGGPVTVTHQDITRYFMTIPEAAQLVIQAGALGEGGEVFLLDMGKPVKIAEMARDLIRFSGKEPDRDIEIIFTGLRPGEKIYEELITEGEGIVETSHEKIMVLKPNGFFKPFGGNQGYRKWLAEKLDELYEMADRQDAQGIRKKLQELVPEYSLRETASVLDGFCTEKISADMNS